MRIEQSRIITFLIVRCHVSGLVYMSIIRAQANASPSILVIGEEIPTLELEAGARPLEDFISHHEIF